MKLQEAKARLAANPQDEEARAALDASVRKGLQKLKEAVDKIAAKQATKKETLSLAVRQRLARCGVNVPPICVPRRRAPSKG